MDEVTNYIVACVFIVVFCILIRVFCTIACRHLTNSNETNTRTPRTPRRRVVRRIRVDPSNTTNTVTLRDRQGNIFTISDDASLNNNSHSYPDFFYLETASDDATRIRSQLEKDDKDLPTYEMVMGISNAGSSSALPNTAELDSVVPAYSEVDPMTTGRSNTTATVTATATTATATAATATATAATPTATTSTATNTTSAAVTVARTLGGSAENTRGTTVENSYTSINLESITPEPSTSRAAAAVCLSLTDANTNTVTSNV